MEILEKHNQFLRWAELQFLFVQQATWWPTNQDNTMINRAVGMTYREHHLSNDDMQLSYEDATLTASILDHTITFNLAVWIRCAFQEVIPNARDNFDWNIRSAFEIAQFI